MNKRFYTVIFFSVIILNLYAENLPAYSFKQISIEQGLPGTNVRDQIQDSRGIMWIAIEALGLCRFDGFKFILYRYIAGDSSGISSNFINRLNEDKLGNIWIATDYGLNRYDYMTGKFQSFFYNENDSFSIPDNTIQTIDKDNEGNLWIGTSNGFASIDPVNCRFKRYLFVSSESKDKYKIQIQRIYQGKDNSFWLGSGYGLIKYNFIEDSYIQWENNPGDNNSIISSSIFDLLEDNLGNLWLATAGGIERLNLKSKTFNHFSYTGNDVRELDQIGINEFHLDKDENLWCATSVKGIVKINTKELTYERIFRNPVFENSLKSDHIRYFYEDRNKTLWIGTKFGGVFKYVYFDKIFNKWPEKYQLFNKVSNIYLLDFFQEKNNIYWLGSKFSGLFKLDLNENKISNYRYDSKRTGSISSDRVHTICRDSENNLWLGTDVALEIFDENANSFKQIASKWITCILEDLAGNIWVGTTRGIYVIDKKKHILKKYDHAEDNNFFSKEDYEISSIFCDSKGDCYFSTKYNGIFIYNPVTHKLIHYSKETSPQTLINANMIRPVFEDDSQNIWIGTKEAGLRLFDKEKQSFISFDSRDGLPSDMVLSIQQDFFGNLWIGTNNGISKFDPEHKIFSNFSNAHGLKTTVAELGASHRFDDGALLFGGNNGFNIFYPEEIIKTERPSSLVVTAIYVNEKKLYRDISFADFQFTLPYKQNNISFEFILANFNEPFRHQFRCFLDGIDDDWKDIGNRNFVAYTNLKPGDYVLKINGANEMGIWCKEDFTVKFRILIPWWQSWIFRILVTLFIIGCLLIIYNLRLNQINKQKKQLEIEVAKRTAELYDAYKNIREISEFGQKLTSTLEINTLESMIYSYFSTFMDSFGFGIGFYDMKADIIEYRKFNENGNILPPIIKPLSKENSLSAYCIKNQKTILINNLEEEYIKYIPRLPDISTREFPHSSIHMPLVVKGKRIGLIALNSNRKNAFNENDLVHIRMIASYLAIALDNANTHKIIEEKNSQLIKRQKQIEEQSEKLNETNTILEERQQQVEEQAEELKVQAEELSIANENLKSSNATKDKLFSIIAHDLKNPFNSVLGFSELLVRRSQELDKAKITKMAESINNSARSIYDLFDNLLNWSRSQTGNIQFSPEKLSVNKLVSENLNLFSNILLQKEISVINNIDNNFYTISDKLIISTVIRNLLSNAIKYTEKGNITINAETIGNKIVVKVNDTGIGIPAKKLAGLFKIERSKSTTGTKGEQGTGLGLIICKEFVELNGGEISVESTEGKGSSFVFTIPLLG